METHPHLLPSDLYHGRLSEWLSRVRLACGYFSSTSRVCGLENGQKLPTSRRRDNLEGGGGSGLGGHDLRELDGDAAAIATYRLRLGGLAVWGTAQTDR